MGMQSVNQILLSWPQLETNRTNVVNELLDNRSFVDATIVCDDDDQIEAHRVLLSASSSFFKNIFERNSHNHPLLYIQGSKKKDMLAIMDFIYSGKTSVLVDDLDRFMNLANNLEVKGLSNSVKIEALEENNTNVQPPQIIIDTSLEETTTSFLREPVKASNIEENNHRYETEDNVPDIVEEDDKKTTEDSCWSCEECSFTSTTNIDMQEHAVKHTGVYLHQCKACLRFFQTRGSLAKHECNKLKIMSPFNASSLRGKEFETLPHSVKEVQDNVIDEYEYDEKVHSLIEKQNGNWACKICNYISLRKPHAKEHVQRHIDGFSHACKTCGKIFTKRYTLRKHSYLCKLEGGF